MENKLVYEKSSGNVFKDLELPNADERLFKAEIAAMINDIIKTKGLNQTSAAALLNIDQPKISALVNGRLSGFTIDRLFRFLLALDKNIEVKVTRKKKSSTRSGLRLLHNVSKRSASAGTKRPTTAGSKRSPSAA